MEKAIKILTALTGLLAAGAAILEQANKYVEMTKDQNLKKTTSELPEEEDLSDVG